MASWIEKKLGEAKVADAGRQVVTEENVAWLEIAVDDRRFAAAVEIVQSVGNVHGDVEPLDYA
jgi:hypothetical protein